MFALHLRLNLHASSRLRTINTSFTSTDVYAIYAPERSSLLDNLLRLAADLLSPLDWNSIRTCKRLVAHTHTPSVQKLAKPTVRHGLKTG